MHCLLSSFGSAETQRGEVAVSGSRMPTFVFAGGALAREAAGRTVAAAAGQPGHHRAVAAPVIATAVTECFLHR